LPSVLDSSCGAGARAYRPIPVGLAIQVRGPQLAVLFLLDGGPSLTAVLGC
jgi:hypothetical protein